MRVLAAKVTKMNIMMNINSEGDALTAKSAIMSPEIGGEHEP